MWLRIQGTGTEKDLSAIAHKLRIPERDCGQNGMPKPDVLWTSSRMASPSRALHRNRTEDAVTGSNEALCLGMSSMNLLSPCWETQFFRSARRARRTICRTVQRCFGEDEERLRETLSSLSLKKGLPPHERCLIPAHYFSVKERASSSMSNRSGVER